MPKVPNICIDFETRGVVYLSTVEEGKIFLGNLGFEFQYKNPRMGKNIFFLWKEIQQVETYVSLKGKIGQQFGLTTDNWAKISFSSKESVIILKKIGEHIGKEKVVRSKNLLQTFIRSIQK